MGGENGLGWNLCQGEGNQQIVEKEGNYSIVEGRKGKKEYCIDCFPSLSRQEQHLLSTVAGLFRKRKGKAERDDLRKFFKFYCGQNLILLESRQVEYLSMLLEREIFGFGAMDFLLENDALEEIACIGIGKEKPVHVFHREHGWLETNLFFSEAIQVRNLVNKMSRSVGRRLSLNSPILNATLPDGSRLSASINPVSFSGPSFTIRKFRERPFTPVGLVENKAFSLELMAFLWIAMQCDCSLLVAGNTGSGKTTSLNALLSFVPCNERIVVVEETPEIRVEHRHFVKLNVVKEQGIGMDSLIVQSLRMRPDRIIVGEVRSREEVSAFIDTMLAGQGKGSYATFHAQSAREAINRLCSLGILRIDLAALDLIMVQKRWNVVGKKGESSEVRRIVEVSEVFNGKAGIGCNCLFRFNYRKGMLEKVGKSKAIFEKAQRSFSFNRKGFEKEIDKRSKFLAGLPGQISMHDFFEKVNNGLQGETREMDNRGKQGQ